MNIFIKMAALFLSMIPIIACAQTIADTPKIEYFSGFSSADKKVIIDTTDKFKLETEESKIIILREIYIDNNELIKSNSLHNSLITSARLANLSKHKTIEEYFFTHIEKTIDAITKNKNIQFEFDDDKRAKFYIRLLASESSDSLRLFSNIVNLIKLGDTTIFTPNEIDELLLEIPYKSDNNYVAELIDAYPYSYNIYPQEKIFNRFISIKNKNSVIEKISQQINLLKEINSNNKINGKIENLSEKINYLEKMINDYKSRFPYSYSQENQISSLFPDLISIIEKLNVENSVPTFYSELPILGSATNASIDDQKNLAIYHDRIHKGVFSKPQEKQGIKYSVGVAYSYNQERKMVYALISNESNTDRTVIVNIQSMNSSGYIIEEIERKNNFIVNGSKNVVIGTGLEEWPFKKPIENLNIVVTFTDNIYKEQETAHFVGLMARQTLPNNDNLIHLKQYYSDEDTFPEQYKSLIESNKINLIHNDITKSVCNDTYYTSIRHGTAPLSNQEYIIYSAECTDNSGSEGTTLGLTLHVVYKKNGDADNPYTELLRLTGDEGSFPSIRDLYDVNNDGDIELCINYAAGLGSYDHYKKVKNGKLIDLVEGHAFAEGEAMKNPAFASNPFVLSH